MGVMDSMRKSWKSQVKQDRFLEHFVAGTTRRTAPSLVGVHRNTFSYFLHRLRELIALELDDKSEAMVGEEIEVDESYFGGKCKGKRGRGSATKNPVFGLLTRVEMFILKSFPIPPG